MKISMVDRVKILFTYPGSTPNSTEIEAMWAVAMPDGYKLDNIPFFVRELADGDVVSARPDADGMLRFEKLVKPSQHSTVRLWFAENHVDDVALVRQRLQGLGCLSELSNLPRLVAVDVPRTVAYKTVRSYLDKLEAKGILEYEESCLGSAHQ